MYIDSIFIIYRMKFEIKISCPKTYEIGDELGLSPNHVLSSNKDIIC